MSFDPERTADALLAGRRARVVMAPLPDEFAPRDEVEGAAAQLSFARRLGAVPPAGFKIGATAKVMQEHLGLHHPAAGFMQADGVHGSGATLGFAGLVAPGVECELAIRLAHDLPPGPCEPARAADAVGALFAAIEVVERRYTDLAAFGAPSLTADQFFHAAAVLGTPCATWRDADLGAIAGHITVDGEERARGLGGDLLGHPLNALAWLASSAVAATFGGLRAGQVVMLGSVTPPIWLAGPGEVRVVFDGLETVTVTLA
jgi:2-keto-4-pentenoate hydratase